MVNDVQCGSGPFFLAAIQEAERGLAEGGIPIGPVRVHDGNFSLVPGGLLDETNDHFLPGIVSGGHACFPAPIPLTYQLPA